MLRLFLVVWLRTSRKFDKWHSESLSLMLHGVDLIELVFYEPVLICGSKNRYALMIISLFSESEDKQFTIFYDNVRRRLIVSADILLDSLVSPRVYRSWETLSELFNIDLSVLDLVYLFEDRVSEGEHCQSLTKKIIE